MIEQFFDLRIATVAAGVEPPPEVHWVRILEPAPREVSTHLRLGWFYKPCYVTYVAPAPRTLEAHVAGFRHKQRQRIRRLLQDVPGRYRLESDPGARKIEEFRALYRRAVVARPRGRDRLAEHTEGFGDDWLGLYLRAGDEMVAGILVHRMRRHLSVAYGGFDAERRRELDLEHYLILQVLDLAARQRVSHVSLGMDTNRYGHHLSLGVAGYKLRLGFQPLPYEPAGRELVRVLNFEPFESGLFFYAYDAEGFVGHLFHRGEPDLSPFRHVNAPHVRTHAIGTIATSRTSQND